MTASTVSRSVRSQERYETACRAMQNLYVNSLRSVLILLTSFLIFKVTVGVMLNYRDYFPPNFDSDFLRGREVYFYGCYQWAFYTHIVSGPSSLMVGLILVSETFRLRFPQWHRHLGRFQVFWVLFFVFPSGLWMSNYASTGTVAAVGFATLSLFTGLCVALGWRSAVNRRFADHRRWMWRCFVLLCSAVALRLIAGLATVTDIEGEWVYPFAAWTSWLVPLTVLEICSLRNRKSRHSLSQPASTLGGQ